MIVRYDIVYSPDDGGYYAEFWDYETGKAIQICGRDISTLVYSDRFDTSKIAKKILNSLDNNQRLQKYISLG